MKTDSIEARDLFIVVHNEFDLIITDQVMSHLTGEEPAEALMAIRPDIPVILCSGYNTQMDEKTAMRNGIRAFAQKPLLRKELARLLRKVLDESPKLTKERTNA